MTAKQAWKKEFIGKWRIIHMPDFDQKDVDEEVPAHITIENGGSGEFHFLLVQGSMCGDFKNDSGEPVFDFTWEGNDECDEAFGDGWMKLNLNESGSAEGEIRFHCGDTHKFQAKKQTKKRSK